MAVGLQQEEKNCIYYCTVTCYNWMPLFELTNFYDHIYKWFGHLSGKGILNVGYVIMPNHMHCLLYLPQHSNSINVVLGNAKRFMAYDIVDRLKAQNEQELLQTLHAAVEPNERLRGKKHEVFQPSFDAKPCYTEEFLLQKLDYIHHNPVNGKWRLVDDFTDYPHSSAAFYELNQPVTANITHFKNML